MNKLSFIASLKKFMIFLKVETFFWRIWWINKLWYQDDLKIWTIQRYSDKLVVHVACQISADVTWLVINKCCAYEKHVYILHRQHKTSYSTRHRGRKKLVKPYPFKYMSFISKERMKCTIIVQYKLKSSIFKR